MGHYPHIIPHSECERLIATEPCESCHRHGTMLMRMYPHPDGVKFKKGDLGMWVYGHCTECEHDTPLWRIIRNKELMDGNKPEGSDDEW